MLFKDYGNLYCADVVNPMWGALDFSLAPALLFYAYVPVLLTSLLIAALLIPKTRQSLRSRPLVAMLLFFVAWSIVVLAQWVLVRGDHMMFSWLVRLPFEVGLFFSAAYFAYVFIRRRDPPIAAQVSMYALGGGLVALTPSWVNIAHFDPIYCEGHYGPLWTVIYGLEAVLIVCVLVFGLYWAVKEKDASIRQQTRVFTFAMFFFLLNFFLFNAYGDATGIYEIDLLGPIGMVAFLAVLGYLIVKYHTFHTKVVATEALVWGVVALVGSQFFYARSTVNLVLNGVTFAAAIIIGIMQIRSVRIEIRQKDELSELLKQRESLQHLVTHKVKGAFTRNKFIFAEWLDGTFGPTNDKMRDMARQGLEFSEDGISSVDQVLNAANLKSGTVTYEMKPVDFKGIAAVAVEQKRGPASRKGLVVETQIEERKFTVTGDAFWLKEVAYNLIDNAVKYSLQGKLTVGLEKRGNDMLYWVRDTGIGISDEDKKNLFTEGGRGKESTKINPDSTGYGLYTIKLVVEGHGGKVWAESEVGKGSTFFVTLPLRE